MFPRQLISHKEVFRAAIGSIAAAAIHHCLNKNGESHAEGNNTPAPRSYHHHTIPPHLPDFFSLSSTSLTSNITNYAHCDASSLSASTSLKIPPLVEDRRSFTYEANDPLEDRRRSGTCGAWTYGAVFDGHGGPQIADMASRRLLERIFDKIYEIDHNNEILVDETMTSAFNDMEQEIIDTIRPAFNTGFGDVAKVGSCVLVALRRGKKLIIANCGDCRVVMGSTSRDAYDPLKQDKIYHTQINRDHNCRVRLEQDNLQKNHPNEPNLIVCKSENACYVKGRLQLTRSLGDAYLKYAEFNGNPALGRSGGRYIPDPYTPPYVSHQPDMHHITLEKEDRFLILGTDGLWDYLRGDAAVDIVFRGMKEGKNEEKIASELVEEALKIAARESGMSFETLKQLPKGRQRRSHHDDTTAVVLFL